jgi:PAS domain-containing protein
MASLEVIFILQRVLTSLRRRTLMREKTSALTTENAFDIERLCHYFSERSPQPVIVVEGEEHVVRYVNDAFIDLVGTQRNQLLGRSFVEAVPEGEANGCIPL